MAGYKDKRRRAPGLLALLLAMLVTLSLGGSRGVAADSPVERMPPPESPEEAAEPEPAPAAEPEPVPEEPEKAPFAPVPESAPVADGYFDDAAFLGDSRTEGFQLYSGLKTGTYYHAVGATVETVFSKSVETPAGKMPLLDAMAEGTFGKIYVMLGVNELGWNKTETFYNQYGKVIDRLRADHPEAEIILQAILPVSARQDAKGSYVNNQRIGVYNEAIRLLAEEKDCAYLNVAEAVSGEDGCLVADWNFDGVHLNVKGCQVWLDYLRTHPVGEVPAELLESEAPAERMEE